MPCPRSRSQLIIGASSPNSLTRCFTGYYRPGEMEELLLTQGENVGENRTGRGKVKRDLPAQKENKDGPKQDDSGM